MESESIGYTLVTVRAQGGDAGETVTYTLAENGTHNAFVELDKEKGRYGNSFSGKGHFIMNSFL